MAWVIPFVVKLSLHLPPTIYFTFDGASVFLIIINFIALACLYLVPFALIMGLGETINPFIAVVTSAYVMLIGSFVPIPGGSGGLEYGFVKFFGIFVVGAKLSSIMIVWRLLTYYLGMFLGALFLIKEE